MGRVDDKVVFITGAARGMGRAHALLLAEQGADIVAVDRGSGEDGSGEDGTSYGLSQPAEVETTARLVRERGRRALTVEADIRDSAALEAAAERAVAEFGRIDAVVANAGIWSLCTETWRLPEQRWQDMIEINLTAQWRTACATVPHLVEGGRGGSLVFISSANGLRAIKGNGHYTAAKHGVIGLMRTLAHELAEYGIRSNAICPGAVDTPMMMNDQMYRLFRPELDNPGAADAEAPMKSLNLLGVGAIEPGEVSSGVLWLVSDESRVVTGIALPIDAGQAAM